MKCWARQTLSEFGLSPFVHEPARRGRVRAGGWDCYKAELLRLLSQELLIVECRRV